MGLAINRGIRTDNPVRGVPRPKLSKSGWHTWTEGEIAQFEAHHAIGSPARLAFALALFTCQRSADLIRMGKQHVSGGGAPEGEANGAWKHGRYSKTGKIERLLVKKLLSDVVSLRKVLSSK